MSRVHLIHWNEQEAREKAACLAREGHDVAGGPPASPSLLREMKNRPPEAVVIDLSRLPSHGRDVALSLRRTRTTRRVPIVFVEGDPAKVSLLKKLLPDAVYTTWSRLPAVLPRAISHPPADPVVPASVLAGYSGTPLPRKLGIRAGSRVALVGAPERFREKLGDLPEGATLRAGLRGRSDLIIWFVRSRRELERGIPAMASRLERGAVWIAWPKQGSPEAADLTQQHVREAGLAAGLVDYKICAIDAVWSGLLFTRRRTVRR